MFGSGPSDVQKEASWKHLDNRIYRRSMDASWRAAGVKRCRGSSRRAPAGWCWWRRSSWRTEQRWVDDTPFYWCFIINLTTFTIVLSWINPWRFILLSKAEGINFSICPLDFQSLSFNTCTWHKNIKIMSASFGLYTVTFLYTHDCIIISAEI